MKVLVIEDDATLGRALQEFLSDQDYATDWLADGERALSALSHYAYDLIVLDLNLPGIDGLEVLRRLRADGCMAPVLILTARDDLSDRVAGLDAGADDYLTKPFNLEELLLRVKVLVKHSQRGKTTDSDMSRFTFGGNEVNFVTYKVKTHAGQEFNLTKKEVQLLKLLISKKDDVVSRQDMLKSIWDYDVYPSTRTIDNFIMTFRKYFEKDPSNPVHFHSIRGVGYRFTA